jgi:hypothetical protein
LSLRLGYKKGVKEFYNSILREFNNEQTLIKIYKKKLEILKKSKNSYYQNLLNYKQKYLNSSEIKNYIFYCSIISFGLLYPFRLLYKLLKWSILMIRNKN